MHTNAEPYYPVTGCNGPTSELAESRLLDTRPVANYTLLLHALKRLDQYYTPQGAADAEIKNCRVHDGKK